MLSKQAAALRLLQCAIRMLLAHEDVPGTYVVAASAARIFRDKTKARGVDSLEDQWALTAFYLGKNYLAGNLPEWCIESPPLVELAASVAEGLKSGTIVKYRDVTVSIPNDSRRSMYKSMSKTFNFLKHADHDHEDAISADEINPEVPILEAWHFFGELFPDVTVPEFDALLRHFAKRNPA